MATFDIVMSLRDATELFESEVSNQTERTERHRHSESHSTLKDASTNSSNSSCIEESQKATAAQQTLHANFTWHKAAAAQHAFHAAGTTATIGARVAKYGMAVSTTGVKKEFYEHPEIAVLLTVLFFIAWCCCCIFMSPLLEEKAAKHDVRSTRAKSVREKASSFFSQRNNKQAPHEWNREISGTPATHMSDTSTDG